MFGDNQAEISDEVLLALESELGELHGILPLVPQRVLSHSQLPPLPNRGEENFARWGLALCWLAATEQRVFHDEIEYCESAIRFANDGQVCEWERFSPMPVFDPVEFVTLTGKESHTWAYWNREHHNAGRHFPEVLALSLTKPFFYASLNAIDLMVHRGLDQRPPKKVRRAVSRPLRDGSKLEESEIVVLSVLLTHHRRMDGPHFDPLVQTDISKKAGCSQSTVC